MQGNISINYVPGRTAHEFHNNAAPERYIVGPVGMGKTVAFCMEILRLAMEQEADHHEHFYPKRDGRAVRPTRWLLVRATYPQLRATLIKTWNEWTGKLGRIVYDSPIRFHAELPMPDGTLVDLEVLFMALDNGRGAENLRSLEVTGVGVSEFAEIGEDVLMMARTRIGRFPKTKKSKVVDPVTGEREVLFGPTRPCIIGESNAPSSRSHWYRLFEVERPTNVRVFKQPPAMLYNYETEEYYPNPEAENIDNLPGGFDYYWNIISGATPEFINVYVMNNYGSTFKGKPVYPMFSPRVHMLGDGYTAVEASQYIPERRQLTIGLDLGLNPAAAIGQENTLGGMTVYDEIVGEDVRFEDFLNEQVIPTLNNRFPGVPVLFVYDPSNPRSALGKHTAAQMLKLRGFAAMPAPSNDVAFRIEAVTHYMQRRDMFKVHPRCATIREGLAGAYHFEEVRGKNGVFKDEPTKNAYSHIMNGLEYLASHFYHQARRDSRKARLDAAHAKDTSRGRRYQYV